MSEEFSKKKVLSYLKDIPGIKLILRSDEINRSLLSCTYNNFIPSPQLTYFFSTFHCILLGDAEYDFDTIPAITEEFYRDNRIYSSAGEPLGDQKYIVLRKITDDTYELADKHDAVFIGTRTGIVKEGRNVFTLTRQPDPIIIHIPALLKLISLGVADSKAVYCDISPDERYFISTGIRERIIKEPEVKKKEKIHDNFKDKQKTIKKGFDNMKAGKISKKLIVVAAIVFFAVITVCSSFTIVPTGYTGVKITFGQVKEATVPNGITAKIPFVQSVEKVNNKQQQMFIDNQIWGETSNRTPVYFENVTVTYKINPAFSSWIYANINNYKDSLITEDIISSAIKSASKTLIDTDVSDRDKIETAAKGKLQASLNDKYSDEVVTVTKVTINNIDFEDSYNNALVEKQQAQIAYERQAIENKKNIEKAEADAEVKKKQAQGIADAAKIEAEGKREAYLSIASSITDGVVKQNAIDKWNGELPAVVGDSDFILNFADGVPAVPSSKKSAATENE